MIRCIRIWTGDDRNSHFEEGIIDLEPGLRGDVLSSKTETTTISFEETTSGGTFAWHTHTGLSDPRRGALPDPSWRHPARRRHDRQRA
jgi:hypothetical protein